MRRNSWPWIGKMRQSDNLFDTFQSCKKFLISISINNENLPANMLFDVTSRRSLPKTAAQVFLQFECKSSGLHSKHDWLWITTVVKCVQLCQNCCLSMTGSDSRKHVFCSRSKHFFSTDASKFQILHISVSIFLWTFPTAKFVAIDCGTSKVLIAVASILDAIHIEFKDKRKSLSVINFHHAKSFFQPSSPICSKSNATRPLSVYSETQLQE
jgi:hypothetical protein